MLQREALDILKMGHNVYLTGAAGSGKTYVLNSFISYLREHNIAVGVTASTGIAATHMNGMTIHSWAGIGIMDELTEHDMERLRAKSQLQKRLSHTKVLIIDEVSMLHGKRLDMVDTVCRAFRDASKPFGGLQVVLSGDLFQLPPVTRGTQPDFVFESRAWQTMNLKICYLSEQHRQDDGRLLDILGAIRSSTVDTEHYEELQERFREPPRDQPITRLYTHNEAVDQVNERQLRQIDANEQIYAMQTRGSKKLVAGLIASCLAPETLRLKTGAAVMFVANSQSGQFVNGTLGRVIGFNDDRQPIVQTDQRTIHVSPHSWKLLDGDKTRAELSQLPLRLAWAITVHKSQGMSLDAAEMDLSRSFEPGMGYVALSRVRDLDGLYLKGMNNLALTVNSQITELDKTLKAKSNRIQLELGKLKSADLDKHHQRVRSALRTETDRQLDNYDEDLFEKLRTWRLKQAKKQDAPAFVVLADKTLKLIASQKPATEQELAAIHGIGPQKLELYAAPILACVSGAQ